MEERDGWGEERSVKDPTGAADTNLRWLQPTEVWDILQQVSDAKEDGWKKLTGWDFQREKEWEDMRGRVSWPESNEVMAHGVWDV